MEFVESFRGNATWNVLREASGREISKNVGPRRAETRYTVDVKDLAERHMLFAFNK